MAKRTPQQAKADKAETVKVPGTKTELLLCSGTEGDPLIPEIIPHYIFRPKLTKYVEFGIKACKNVILTGDAATGKTSLITQLAALTRTPLRRVNVHGETDTSLFLGRDLPTEVDGVRTMIYREGILATAMRKGQWLLIDEIDAALQPVLFVLQQVLEKDGKLLLDDHDGTIVERHPRFRIFATGNTIGKAGKNKLLYSGTMGRMNEATLDRFGVVVHVDYLKPEQEEKVIAAEAPNTDPDFIKVIVRVANDIREQLANEQLSCTFGTRRCIDWAQAMEFFHPAEAAQITILDKLNTDDSEVLAGIVQRYFGD